MQKSNLFEEYLREKDGISIFFVLISKQMEVSKSLQRGQEGYYNFHLYSIGAQKREVQQLFHETYIIVLKLDLFLDQ